MWNRVCGISDRAFGVNAVGYGDTDERAWGQRCVSTGSIARGL